MRTEISIVAGPKGWGDSRQSWLSRVPRRVREILGTQAKAITYRTVKSLWYGEITDPEHYAVRTITRAASLVQARGKALDLAETYQRLIGGLDGDLAAKFGDEVARLERVARMLRGEA